MPTILIVSSNNDIRELFKFILSDQRFIVEAKNGEEGIELFDLYKPDIVIIEMTLPVISGNDFVKYVRQAKHPVKVIVLSSYFSSTSESHQKLRNEADIWFTMPFEMDEVLCAVKHLSN